MRAKPHLGKQCSSPNRAIAMETSKPCLKVELPGIAHGEKLAAHGLDSPARTPQSPPSPIGRAGRALTRKVGEIDTVTLGIAFHVRVARLGDRPPYGRAQHIKERVPARGVLLLETLKDRQMRQG